MAPLDDGLPLGDELAERAAVLADAAEVACLTDALSRAFEGPVTRVAIEPWRARMVRIRRL
jgi:hypothetical protein